MSDQDHSPHDFSRFQISEFLENLGSESPTPGGGATAALTAAQGVALFAMLGRLSSSKSLLWEPFVASMDLQSKEFLNLAREDAEAFSKVIAAMGLPKKDPHRSATLQEALRGAAKPPLGVMELSWDVLQRIEPLLVHANPHVISDGAIGVIHLCAAIESSAYNVRINLKYLKDEGFQSHCVKIIGPIEQSLSQTKKQLLEKIQPVLLGT